MNPPTDPSTPKALPPPHEGHPDRWRILAVLCAALCIVVLDNTILSVAVPSVGEALRADETSLQWITAAYSLVLAALLLPLAGLGDRFGRKGLLLVGVVIFGSSSAGAAFAATSGQLTVARGLMGIGGAATMPATLAVLGNVFPEHERGRAIALWSGVSGIAGAAGPVVGGFLLDHYWWGSVFLVNVPVCLAVFVAAARLVPTSKDPATPPVDVAGSLIWSAALALLLFSCIEGGERGWSSAVVIGSIAAGLALLGAFAWWERRTPHPLLAPAAVADHRMQAGMVAVPVIFFSVFGAQFVFTQWLQGVRGLSPLTAGLCFAPNAAAVLIGSLLCTRLVGRLGQGRAVAVGLLVLAGALATGALFHGSVLPVLLAVTVAGFGVGLACPPAVELIMGSVPPEHAGQAAGVNETIVEAGGAFGIAVMGTVLAVTAGGVGSVAPDRLVGPAGAAARQHFTAALHAPLLVAVGLLVLAAAVVLRRTQGTSAGRPSAADAGSTAPVAVAPVGAAVAMPAPPSEEQP
ncbi:MFS transporter [Aquihabitans sp. G128]|uniref:MFS transporter n=1 Tax=Aquihabitans sp. G128 TaxID=2849779 RepID=UPI001C22BF35|nr:MFS transporter [Aquihabitans sp. G128]QXC60199.1 MFS transporter [Aquihabitans sp. G128]